MKKLLLATGLSIALFAGNIHLNVDNSNLKRISPNQNGMILSFSPIVKKVIPSVVNISTEKVIEVKYPENFQRFFNDPLFKRFFGPFGNNQNKSQKRKEYALGSGVILSKNGYIVTNYHVVSAATKITVKTIDGKIYKAKLIGSDPKTDLAVIKIKADNLKPVTIADSAKLQVGDLTLAIGNPFGLKESVTAGIVSALNRDSIGLNSYENFIQTDAAINPGNSGGALVDMKGRLIGINSAILTRSGANNGIGFAIPSNMMKFVVTSLIKKGKVVRGYLGVMISNVGSGKTKLYGISHGVLINKVEPHSAASQAGLKPGDIIVAINGENVSNAGELRNKIAFKGAGSEVTLKIYRNGTFKTIKATLKTLKTKIKKIQNIESLKGVILKQKGTKVVIANIRPNSYAALIGLQRGDIVKRIKTIKTQKWINISSINEITKLLKGLNRRDALIEVQRENTIFIVQL